MMPVVRRNQMSSARLPPRNVHGAVSAAYFNWVEIDENVLLSLGPKVPAQFFSRITVVRLADSLVSETAAPHRMGAATNAPDPERVSAWLGAAGPGRRLVAYLLWLLAVSREQLLHSV
jgi:hypothetical protein